MSLQKSPNSLKKSIGIQPKMKLQQEEAFDDILSERSGLDDSGENKSDSCGET
jgi:hypothetical protein